MRGRKPDPAGVKTAKGNPGRRPIAEEPTEGRARAPAWLKGDAADIWTRLAPDLQRMNLLQRPDELAFGRYCEMFALWLRARKAVETGDLVSVTESEHVTMERLNKNLQAMLLLEKRLQDLEDRFGLNPANRQRIYSLRAQTGANLPGDLPFNAPAAEEVAQRERPVGFLMN